MRDEPKIIIEKDIENIHISRWSTYITQFTKMEKGDSIILKNLDPRLLILFYQPLYNMYRHLTYLKNTQMLHGHY